MILVTFYSMSSALFLESLLQEAGISCEVIPVPRALSSSCGYAAEVDMADAEALRTLCDSQGVEWEGIHLALAAGYRTVYAADTGQ